MKNIELNTFFDLYPSPYPFDVPDRLSKGFRRVYDLKDEQRLIFPEKRSSKDKIKDVLIIGSGHTEGIYHALRNPDLEFTCIDISEKAITSSQENAKQLKLNNITFENIDFLELKSKTKYDVIYAFNVFQYFDNPSIGFTKCNKLLKDDGALIVSVSSSYYFEDIDFIRGLLLDLNYSFDKSEDIKEAFNFVKGLDNFHPSKIRMVDGDKWINENDFVSRYLIPIHKSYSIYDLFDEISSSNFYFQGWYHNYLYYPSALLREKNELHITLFERISSLSNLDKYDCISKIFRSKNDRFSHTFCLRKNKEFEFYDNKLLDNEKSIVSLRPYQLIKTHKNQSESFAIISNFQKRLKVKEHKIANLVSKPKKISDLLADTSIDLTNDDLKNTLSDLLESSIIFLYE